DKAIALALRGLETYGHELTLLQALARWQTESGEHLAAAETLRRARELAEQPAEIARFDEQAARALVAAGRPEDAVNLLERAGYVDGTSEALTSAGGEIALLVIELLRQRHQH